MTQEEYTFESDKQRLLDGWNAIEELIQIFYGKEVPESLQLKMLQGRETINAVRRLNYRVKKTEEFKDEFYTEERLRLERTALQLMPCLYENEASIIANYNSTWISRSIQVAKQFIAQIDGQELRDKAKELMP